MARPTETSQELLDRIHSSTKEIRGESNRGHDTLLFLNTHYESFPVFLQQETLISSSSKAVFNNLWIWAKTKQAGTIPASLFPGYSYIHRATGLGRGTIASCMTQLRLQRYITLVQKVRNERGSFVGNDYILNDEPMELSDTLMIDKDYIDFVTESLNHRHQGVSILAELIKNSIEAHIESEANPFRPATHLERIETRQQAAQVIQQRLFPEENKHDIPVTHYFGIPIEKYQVAIDQVHKVNMDIHDDNHHVHEVNSDMDRDKNNGIDHVHKVNMAKSDENSQVHKVNAVMNTEVNACSSSDLYNTTTTDTEFTDENTELIYPAFETANELAICKLHIAQLDPQHQQPILDELAARMKNTKKEKLDNPIGYLKGWLIKNLNDGGIPYTSEGAKIAAYRKEPSLQQDRLDGRKQRALELELNSEIQHLKRLIEYQKTQGVDPQELIQQHEKRKLELVNLKARKAG